jgi:hypothetical protein
VSLEVDGVEAVMDKEAAKLGVNEVSDKVEGVGDVAGEMAEIKGDANMTSEMEDVEADDACAVNAKSRAS